MNTANRFRGVATGAGFFTGFGTLWIALALYALDLWTRDRAVAVGAGAAVLAFGCSYLARLAKHWPTVEKNAAQARTFLRVNLAQWAAIGILSPAFGHYHLDGYICSAITAVVGIHFFPLAKLFRWLAHTVTGAVLTLWAGLSVLIVPIKDMQGVTALGTGAILWISALYSLTVGILAASRFAGIGQGSTQPA